MPIRTIVCIISTVLGAGCLATGLGLTIADEEKGVGTMTVIGLVLLTLNGFFIGFGLRELYSWLEKPEQWGKWGAAALGGTLTAIGALSAAAGNMWLILSDGPNAKVRLPGWGFVLFGAGLSIAIGGFMWLGSSSTPARESNS